MFLDNNRDNGTGRLVLLLFLIQDTVSFPVSCFPLACLVIQMPSHNLGAHEHESGIIPQNASRSLFRGQSQIYICG
jgi:hypothetical protein